MTKQKKSTTAKRFFIKDKEIITDPDAPVVSGEFVDKQPEGIYHGQTIEVTSDTKLEEDTGRGKPFILRSFEFSTDPEFLRNVKNGKVAFPTLQELFDAHIRGISSKLWVDGFIPVLRIDPRIVFSKDRRRYLIMVWAEPRLGKVIIESPKTLTEIAYGNRKDTNTI